MAHNSQKSAKYGKICTIQNLLLYCKRAVSKESTTRVFNPIKHLTLMRLKPFLPLVVLVFSTVYANAQELYQYVQDSVYQTAAGPISIIRAGGAYIHYAKAEPAYERFEPSTSTDSTIARNDDGLWEIDYSKFVKPAQSVVCSMIRATLTQYMSMLKASCKDNDQVWITVRTDSQGVVKNVDVKI